MTTVFLICALFGGTILVCQFVLTLVGLGDAGFDMVDDLPDSADADMADSVHFDTDGDAHAHESTWLFGIISFRTLVAAATFFGIAGMAASSGGMALSAQLMLALACGMAAMFGVHWLMKSFYRLGQSGTLRITNAIGKTGTVYIPIPQANQGHGKIQLKVQDRLEEFAAVTASDAQLSTGAKVVVVGVVSGNTLEVRPLHEAVEAEA